MTELTKLPNELRKLKEFGLKDFQFKIIRSSLHEKTSFRRFHFFILVPNKPVMTGATYVSTEASITIQASITNPVTVLSGGIDFYKMSSSSTGTATFPYSNKDQSMEITRLTGGTKYNLLFKSSINCYGIKLDSTEDSDGYSACTR